MKAADLYRLMESPALLTEDTLQQLKQIVDEFPYFQIARMLYLKNLAVLNDIRFGAELKKMAIYVPDRRKLFTLIEGERFGLQLQSAKEENPTREDAFSLIDAFLSNREEEEPKTDASSVPAVRFVGLHLLVIDEGKRAGGGKRRGRRSPFATSRSDRFFYKK